MCHAAEIGQYNIVKKELKRADPNEVRTNGYTPLHFAAYAGHTDVVRLLLDGGANPNIIAMTEDSVTPLFLAAQKGHTAVVRLLLAHNADPNAISYPLAGDTKKKTKTTPCYVAAGNGHEAVVRLLLAHNADPNAKTNNGATPCVVAAQNGHAAVVNALLAGGADPKIAMNDKSTPLMMARDRYHRDVVNLLEADDKFKRVRDAIKNKKIDKPTINLWTEAAEHHTLAQYYLGLLWYNGKGVEQDFNKAVEWYTKAAKQNHAPAQNALGDCYKNGEGVEQDFNKAVELYTMAAEQNHEDAKNNMKEAKLLMLQGPALDTTAQKPRRSRLTWMGKKQKEGDLPTSGPGNI